MVTVQYTTTIQNQQLIQYKIHAYTVLYRDKKKMDTIKASKETNKLHTILSEHARVSNGVNFVRTKRYCSPNFVPRKHTIMSLTVFQGKIHEGTVVLGSNVLQLLVYFSLKIITIRLDANAHTRKDW